MSRIGKQPIVLPNGVTVIAEADGLVTVTGPRGTLSRRLSPDMKIMPDVPNGEDDSEQDGPIVIEGGPLRVERPTDSDRHRAMHGLTRSLVANMVAGVSTGFQKILQVNGVGYRATVSGGKLTLNVGYSHPVEITPREGITFSAVVDPATRSPVITVSGNDKETVGQQSAEVRKVRKPEPYKGKGIKYSDEVVRRKAGKSGKAGAGKAGGKGGKK